MHSSSFLPAALPLCALVQRAAVFPDCNCNMLKHVFMIPKICRWRLHNPLAVLIIKQMRRVLKCTSKLFHAHFTSVMREAPANFWVLNSITRLIQSRSVNSAREEACIFFFRGPYIPHISNTGSLQPLFFIFIYERDYRALEIRHSLITCRIHDKQRFGKLQHTFSAKRYNTNYFVPLVHASHNAFIVVVSKLTNDGNVSIHFTAAVRRFRIKSI